MNKRAHELLIHHFPKILRIRIVSDKIFNESFKHAHVCFLYLGIVHPIEVDREISPFALMKQLHVVNVKSDSFLGLLQIALFKCQYDNGVVFEWRLIGEISK